MIIWCIVFIVGLIFWRRLNGYAGNFIRTYWVALGVYTFLNVFFYPSLLQYQAGSNAANYINQYFNNKSVYSIDRVSYSLSFYSNGASYDVSNTAIHDLVKKEKPLLIYADDAAILQLQQSGRKVTVVKQFEYFHVSQLNGTFINHTTRKKSLIFFNIALVE